jgi:thiol-disulfide isomerase/thioredoxin
MIPHIGRIVIVAAAAIGTLAGNSVAQAERKPLPELRIGAKAPELKVGKWFKGSPVTELKEGEVYVLEFWATWCGPCIAAMPHVTELAKKYEGKATIAGISVWEHEQVSTDDELFKKLEAFVEKQGDRMVYSVGAEGLDHAMGDNWLRAAGQNGIPCTMIIGRDKKIAWIGHPMAMDKPLEEIVAGTFDTQKAAEEFAQRWEEQQAQQEIMEPITAAFRAKDHKALLAAIDKAVAAKPELERSLAPIRFEAMINADEAAAAELMTKMAQRTDLDKSAAQVYNMWIAMSRNPDAVKGPQWEKLADLLAKLNEQTNNDKPTYLAAYADALNRAGQLDKAIEIQTKAIEAGTTRVGAGIPPAWLETQKKKLEEWQAKQGK